MELEKAKVIADSIVDQLKPYCQRILIVGSVRRKCPQVKDIDILLIPENQGMLIYQLQGIGTSKLAGSKLIRLETLAITIDIYLATPKTWGPLLLIRTGSAQHNIKLCALARRKGMSLRAGGSGLWNLDTAERIAGDTEESIFEALGLPYVPPEKRD